MSAPSISASAPDGSMLVHPLLEPAYTLLKKNSLELFVRRVPINKLCLLLYMSPCPHVVRFCGAAWNGFAHARHWWRHGWSL